MSIIQIFSITWQVGSPSVIKYQNIKSNNKYWAINSLELFTNWKLDWLGVRSTVSSPDQLMFCKVGSWILNMLKSFILLFCWKKGRGADDVSIFSMNKTSDNFSADWKYIGKFGAGIFEWGYPLLWSGRQQCSGGARLQRPHLNNLVNGTIKTFRKSQQSAATRLSSNYLCCTVQCTLIWLFIFKIV